jgi:hypothetical protein
MNLSIKSILAEHKGWTQRIQKILPIIVLGIIILYLCIFGYLNLFQFTEFIDSDTASEALLAREIWESKFDTPPNWAPSTEHRMISTSTLAALFYGLTGSMSLAMGLSCTICTGIIGLGTFLLFREAGLSTTGVLSALLILVSFPIGGGGKLPFFTYLLFLFAGYYVPHTAAFLYGMALYFRIKKYGYNKKRIVAALFLAGLVVLLGASGMRCLQVVTIPMVLMELIQSVKSKWRNLRTIPYVGLLLISNLGGMLRPTSLDYPVFFLPAGEVINRLLGVIPASILECLGTQGGSSLKSLPGLMQLFIYLITAIAFCSLCYFLKFFFRQNDEKKQQDNGNISQLLLYFTLSVAFTTFVLGVTTAAPYSYYFFVIIFLFAGSLGTLVSHLEQRRMDLWCALLVLLLVYAGTNIKYTYAPALEKTGSQTAYQEVITYMENEGISYGYSQFWNANRITLLSEGKITMGNVYDMGKLEMYWWLTNTQWYVPTLPEDMETAYVVTYDEQESFLAGVNDKVKMVEGFANDRFVVYLSDRNLVRRP